MTVILPPKHQAILDAVSEMTSGLFLASIHRRVPKIGYGEAEDILMTLEKRGLVKRSSTERPILWKRVWATPPDDG